MTRTQRTNNPASGSWRLVALAGGLTLVIGLVIAWIVWSGSTADASTGLAAALSAPFWAILIGATILAMWFVHRLASATGAIGAALTEVRKGRTISRTDLGALARHRQVCERLEQIAERLRDQANRVAVLENEREAVLRSMDGAVVVLDPTQRVERMNRAAEWMMGVSESMARGRLIQEVVREADLIRFVAESLGGGRFRTAEIHLRGDEERRVRATSSQLTDADGRGVGLLIVLTDVTQLRRLEAVRSDFAANVSHELRTPITNIRGYLETLLESGLDDREQGLEFLRIVARNAERLSAIVEDMLTLTTLEESSEQHGLGRGDQGPREAERLEVDQVMLRDVVDASMSELESERDSKDMTVTNEVPQELAASINPTLVQQAVTNLLSNALRYSPGGRRVWLRGALHDEGGSSFAVISVVDEGPGISEQHLSRLFERFYRVDKARSREAGGTGLGLAIVKHIAQMHGGRVEAESEEGRGSTFHLFLPAQHGAGAATRGGEPRNW